MLKLYADVQKIFEKFERFPWSLETMNHESIEEQKPMICNGHSR